MLAQVFCLYFCWVFFLFLIDCFGVISGKRLKTIEICIAIIFSTLAFLSPLLLVSFDEQKLLILMLLSLSYFSFMVSTFCVQSKKFLFIPRS